MHETLDVCTSFMMSTGLDGSLIATLMFKHSMPATRRNPTVEWIRDMVAALGGHIGGARPRSCLVRVDGDGQVVAISTSKSTEWIDIRPAATVFKRSPVDSARSYLNKKRAMIGLRDITGYSDDDIIADARLYGWRES